MPTRVRGSVCTQHKLLWLEAAWQLLNLQLFFPNFRQIAETPADFSATPDDSKQASCLEHNLLSLPLAMSSYSSTCLLPDEARTPGDTATPGCSFYPAEPGREPGKSFQLLLVAILKREKHTLGCPAA